jgi:hypothetical protein
VATGGQKEKSQIPNPKSQTNSRIQFPMERTPDAAF